MVFVFILQCVTIFSGISQLSGFILTEDFMLRTYDENEDVSLQIGEFRLLCQNIFRNERGERYEIPESTLTEMFDSFDKDGDGSLNEDEFSHCWSCWIMPILKPKAALIIVDVQNDFVNGSLAISKGPAGENGEEVIEPLNTLMDTFDTHIYTKDWHPEDHISFYDNVCQRDLDETSPITNCSEANLFDTVVFEGPPKIEQTLWPVHCVQKSFGSELHPQLRIEPEAKIVLKGFNSDVDSYSAFFDNQKLGQTELQEFLKEKEITDVYVGGLATDYCVGFTALDALELGFRTILLEDCSRGIAPDPIKETLASIRKEGGLIINSSEVPAMVEGKDRRVELGHYLSQKC